MKKSELLQKCWRHCEHYVPACEMSFALSIRQQILLSLLNKPTHKIFSPLFSSLHCWVFPAGTALQVSCWSVSKPAALSLSGSGNQDFMITWLQHKPCESDLLHFPGYMRKGDENRSWWELKFEFLEKWDPQNIVLTCQLGFLDIYWTVSSQKLVLPAKWRQSFTHNSFASGKNASIHNWKKAFLVYSPCTSGCSRLILHSWKYFTDHNNINWRKTAFSKKI